MKLVWTIWLVVVSAWEIYLMQHGSFWLYGPFSAVVVFVFLTWLMIMLDT